MSDRDDETTGEPWRTRPRTADERVEWSTRRAETSRTRIRDGKILGVLVWVVTFGVVLAMLAIPSGHDSDTREPCPAVLDGGRAACGGHALEVLGKALLLTIPGLALGTIMYVPRRRDLIPSD